MNEVLGQCPEKKKKENKGGNGSAHKQDHSQESNTPIVTGSALPCG